MPSGDKNPFSLQLGEIETLPKSISVFTKTVGAIRGLHYQAPPHSEAKLVRCLRGRVWDVAVDLRSDSPTYGQWHGAELSPEKANALLSSRRVCPWVPGIAETERVALFTFWCLGAGGRNRSALG
jgi:dTDP-4-dehydrorhamnose 3,5-epimerase-like enzyme